MATLLAPSAANLKYIIRIGQFNTFEGVQAAVGRDPGQTEGVVPPALNLPGDALDRWFVVGRRAASVTARIPVFIQFRCRC